MVSVGGKIFIEDAPVERWIVCIGWGMRVGEYSVYFQSVSLNRKENFQGNAYNFGNGSS